MSWKLRCSQNSRALSEIALLSITLLKCTVFIAASSWGGRASREAMRPAYMRRRTEGKACICIISAGLMRLSSLGICDVLIGKMLVPTPKIECRSNTLGECPLKCTAQ